MFDAFTKLNVSLTSLILTWLGITWVLVYRTDKYKRLKAEVEKQSKKRKYDLTWLAKSVYNDSD